MSSASTLLNLVLTTVRVVGSTVVGKHSAVLVGGDGTVGSTSLEDENEDAPGEGITDGEFFSAPGIVWRPRPPETAGGEDLAAEARGIRTAEGIIPLAWRDLRFNLAFPAPKAGSVALVGYGGGFLSFDDSSENSGDQKASVTTLYVPYSFSGGTPAKAMAIAIDPVAESMMLVHGDGYAIVMDKDNGITARADASTYWNMKPGSFEAVANTINLRGNVALGVNTAAAVPLMAGVATQPTPSVFFSPI